MYRLKSLFLAVFIAGCTLYDSRHGLPFRGPNSAYTNSCFEVMESLLLGPEFWKRKLDRFKAIHSSFKRITKQDNLNFMRLSREANVDSGVLFFHVENSVLKKLNDSYIKDKQITYAITVLFQKIMADEIEQSTLLSSALKAKYADYKSMRLALEAPTPEEMDALWKELSRVFARANGQFIHMIDNMPMQRLLNEASEKVQDPRYWFVPGVGRTPSRSAIASRIARSIKLSEGRNIATYWSREEAFKAIHEEIKELHSLIESRFKNYDNFLVQSSLSPDRYLLGVHLFDLIRKIEEPSRQHYTLFKDLIDEIYGVKLTWEDYQLLIKYLEKIDVFSPPVYQEETLAWNFKRAVHGVASVDLARKGALGQFLNSDSLLNSTSLTAALHNIREGYWKVDASIKRSREWFLSAINYNGPPEALGDFVASGDDLVYFPKSSITKAERHQIAKQVAKTERPYEYRMVFLPSKYINSEIDIPEKLLSSLLIEGENLEKAIRRGIARKLGLKFADSFAIAIAIRPYYKGLSCEVILSSSNLKFHSRIRDLVAQEIKNSTLIESHTIQFLTP